MLAASTTPPRSGFVQRSAPLVSSYEAETALELLIIGADVREHEVNGPSAGRRERIARPRGAAWRRGC